MDEPALTGPVAGELTKAGPGGDGSLSHREGQPLPPSPQHQRTAHGLNCRVMLVCQGFAFVLRWWSWSFRSVAGLQGEGRRSCVSGCSYIVSLVPLLPASVWLRWPVVGHVGSMQTHQRGTVHAQGHWTWLLPFGSSARVPAHMALARTHCAP